MTIDELKMEVSKLKKTGVDVTPLVTEIYKKLSLAFASLAFIIVALPLAIKVARQEKSVNFGLSVAIIIVYYLLFVGGEAASLKNLVHPFIGIWFPNIFMIASGAVLMFKTLGR